MYSGMYGGVSAILTISLPISTLLRLICQRVSLTGAVSSKTVTELNTWWDQCTFSTRGVKSTILPDCKTDMSSRDESRFY